MLERFLSAEQLRKRLLKKTPPGPLADFLQHPFVSVDTPLKDIELVALDLEATGLDFEKDEILSVGYTVIRGLAIVLGESGHFLVRPNQSIPEQTAVIHGILDDASKRGAEPETALLRILELLKHRVMIAHHANIEYSFINRACNRLFGGVVVFPLIDTFAIEYNSLKNRGITPVNTDLRLTNLRREYNLPRYPAHNALSDAVATAELFLAQIEHRSGNRDIKLKEVIAKGESRSLFG